MWLVVALLFSIPLGLDLYMPVPEDNPITSEIVELGRQLFLDRRLSRDGRVACVVVPRLSPRLLHSASPSSRRVQSEGPPKRTGSDQSRLGPRLFLGWARGDARRAGAIKPLVIRSRKTGEERTVPLPPRVAYSVSGCCFWGGPKWFPDNRSVLIESGDAQGAGFGFYRLAINSGNTELLAHVPGRAFFYDLSPDGRTIYYIVNLEDRMALMRFDIEIRRESELKNIPCCLGEFVSLAVSPDGLQLAMVLLGGIVEVMPAAGGESREVFRPAPNLEQFTGALRHALAWTPDQRFLLLVRGDDRSLWKVPAAGGQPEKVGIPMENIKNLAVHPDGRQVVFDAATEEPTQEIWALENFLPR